MAVMGNTSNPMVDVTFQDLTNYAAASSTDDIAGVVLDTSWGPCGVPTVFNSVGYQTYFNPKGLGRLNSTMATVQRYFATGGSFVEGVRLGSNEVWRFVYLDGDAFTQGTLAYSGDSTATDFAGISTLSDTTCAFRLLYPGGFPMQVSLSMASKLSGVQLYTLQVSAYSGIVYDNAGKATASYSSLLESLTVSFVPLTLNGVSYFYADVIASQSAYLYADVEWAYSQGAITVPEIEDSSLVLLTISPSTVQGLTPTGITDAVGTVYKASDYQAAVEVFRDRDLSSATLLLSSYTIDAALAAGETGVSSTGVSVTGSYVAMLTAYSTVAETRKDLNFLVGFPTLGQGTPSASMATWGGASATWESQQPCFIAWFNAVANAGLNMFTEGLVAWERYTLSTLLGRKTFNLDGTAGWAGRVVATAGQLRNRNQPPSYKAYGAYSGSLVRSLTFDQVYELHQDYGIGSIYTTASGNYIFNIRTLYGVTTSYFAQMNVMRVTAALLAGTFDEVEQVLHTDVAANRSSRIALESRLNQLMSTFISRSELKSASYADVGDSINTDSQTQGGRSHNIHLVCYFIGLTERVNITVIATDDSVSVSDISVG